MTRTLSRAFVARTFACCAAIALASGCTTATTSTQTFVATGNPELEASYVAADADFDQYTSLFASDVGIFFPANAAPAPEDQQRTRRIFREAFLPRLEGYRIVDSTGPSTLDVRASIIDYRNAASYDVPNVRRELQGVARAGALMFMMELRDSQTGRVLARGADSVSAPPFSTSPDVETDWSEVEVAAARWATLFREFLDANLRE